MPQIGPAEILVILLVGLLVFGPKRLPEIGRQVGRAMREVKKFQDTVKGELDEVLHFDDDDDAPTASSSIARRPPVTAATQPGAPGPAPGDHGPRTAHDCSPGFTVRPSRFRAPGPRPTT